MMMMIVEGENDDGPPRCTISLIYWDLTKTQLTVTGSGRQGRRVTLCTIDPLLLLLLYNNQHKTQNANTSTNTSINISTNTQQVLLNKREKLWQKNTNLQLLHTTP